MTISSTSVRVAKNALRESIIQKMDAALFNGESTDRWPDQIEVFLDLYKLEQDLIKEEFNLLQQPSDARLDFEPASEFYPEAEKVVHAALDIVEQYSEPVNMDELKAEIKLRHERLEAFRKENPDIFGV